MSQVEDGGNDPRPPPHAASPYLFAACMSRQSFSGLKGISRCVTPNGARASMIALATAGPEPMVRLHHSLWHQRIDRSRGDGRSVSRVGTMEALGMA